MPGRPALKVLNAEPKGYSPRARATLERVAQVHEENCDRARLLGLIGDFDAVIVRLRNQVDREVLDATPRLRAVSSATTGLDHIDLEHAARRGVEVLSLRGETEFLRTIAATAEHTWALLLALIRRIPAASRHVQDGGWDRDRFRGRELYGKRLGVLGLGRLGSKVARFGLAFGMKVTAYDPHPAEWVEGVDRAQSLDDLLRSADVLSIHVPLDDETTGMIGKEEIGLLPSGAIVVNTSRGQIVDEPSLIEALREGRLAGAALDVLADERVGTSGAAPAAVGYAREHTNLLITPHIGGATAESMERTEVFMAEKLAGFLSQLKARV